jgi:hypothetical protein
MSLIGSLYEKYGYQEPPQVDMLAIIAGGIAAPALAQYFAQDIQEMVRYVSLSTGEGLLTALFLLGIECDPHAEGVLHWLRHYPDFVHL